MTQFNPILGANLSGLTYRAQDNDSKRALLSHHKGSSAPTYAEAGMIWLDDSDTPWKLKVHDGSDWIVMGEVNSSTNMFSPYLGAASIRLLNYAADTGDADAYVISPSPAIAAYAAGQIITLRPANANTGASTVTINGLSAKTVKTLDGADLAAGMLTVNGVYLLIYDGMNFVLLNGSGILPIVDGGTGAATAAAARSNLGLVIGTNVQAYDATLAALAGLATGADKIPYSTGTDTFGQLDFKDEDNMASDSATALPSQQSVKAYADALFAAVGKLEYLGSLSIASGSTASMTGLGADNKGYVLFVLGYKNSSGAGDTLRVALSSNNGSSYGSVRVITPARVSGDLFDCLAIIGNTAAVGEDKQISCLTWESVNDTYDGFVTIAETGITGAINAMRFSASVNNLAGTAIYFYGIK